MPRLMYDSVTARDIPSGAQLVMGYADGTYKWSAADWSLFPNIPHVRLAIGNATYDAQVIDIEPGNNDALSCVSWVEGKWARGETPTVYCFTDLGPIGFRISDVRKACDDAGVKRPLFLITHFDNEPGSFDPQGDPEIIGKQYANSDLTGGHYDASVVADFWPGIDKEITMATPQYAGQSVSQVSLVVGEVSTEVAFYDYGAGPRAITFKLYATKPGMWPVIKYPPADPDADPTEDLAAQPALFVIAVRAA